MQELILEQVSSFEQSGDPNKITIPTVIKSVPLLTPGNWNGLDFSAEEIERAFMKTDWKDKKNYELIKDHADKPLSVDAWVGYVKNARVESGRLVGDLELWDEDMIRKLVYAKAKFGISAKVRGVEVDGAFRNFTYANFSIVDDPACKDAYINLSNEVKEMNIQHAVLELAKKGMDKKKKDWESMTEEDFGAEFDKMVAKIKKALKKQHPDWDDKKITSTAFAIANSRTKKMEDELNAQIDERREHTDTKMSEQETQKTEKSLSVEELSSKIDLVLSEVSKLNERVKKLEEEDEVSDEPEMDDSDSEELAKLKKEVEELKAKRVKPIASTNTAELSNQPGMPTHRHSRGTLELASMLKKAVSSR